jgi:exopolysaccharide biosynthesis WecB/TagA/CpsF family protein
MSPSTGGVDATEPQNIPILGVPVFRLAAREAIALIGRRVESSPPVLLAYANAHALNVAARDPDYDRVLRERADIVLNDGIGLQLAARMRGTQFPENLNGSDLNPRILELAAERGWKVFFLGAADGVAERAAQRLSAAIPGLTVVGTHHGFFEDAASDEVVGLVRSSEADVLLVAMGNPRQEMWLARHLAGTGSLLGIGVGAFFDFIAGEQRRAPSWMNRVGLEWTYRLVREPGRMWRRYVLGNPLFLARAWRARKGERKASG